MIWIESEIFVFCFLLDCTRWIVSATIPFKVRRDFAKKRSSEKRPQFLNGVEYGHEISHEWTWKELLHFMFSSWVHQISSFKAICRGNLAKIHIFNNYITYQGSRSFVDICYLFKTSLRVIVILLRSDGFIIWCTKKYRFSIYKMFILCLKPEP